MRFLSRRLALVLFSSVCLAPSLQAEVHFKSLSFAEAKKLAAKEKKKIMVDFYTDWCGWCKVLDKKTYSDDAVGKIADAKFISVKIDAEKGEGIELAKASKVTGYPTIVFFNPDGKEVDRVVGYQDADRFAQSLNMAAGGGTAGILTELDKNPNSKDASKWLIAANYYAEHHDNKKALGAFSKVAELDSQDDKKLREQAQYGIAFTTEGEARWDALEHAIVQYPNREEGSQAVMLLVKHDLESSASTDQVLRIMDIWAMHHPEDGNTLNYFAWTAAEKGVLLDKADEFAARAVALAQDAPERASALDTHAEVMFKLDRASEALQMEQQALAMLDPVKDKKLYDQLAIQKAKFEKESASNHATDVPVPSSTIAH